MTTLNKLSAVLELLRISPSSKLAVFNSSRRFYSAHPRASYGLNTWSSYSRHLYAKTTRSFGSIKTKTLTSGSKDREKLLHKCHRDVKHRLGCRYLSTCALLHCTSSSPSSPSGSEKATASDTKQGEGQDDGNGANKKPSIKLPDPEIDWNYILTEENFETIKENIDNRKGVGNLERVKSLWNKLNYPEEVEIEVGEDLTKIKKQLLSEAISLPNRTHPDVPIGDESQNHTVETVGSKREFEFRPNTVSEIGEDLGMLRTENLGLTTGPKTYYLLDGFALLEQALIQYTIEHLERAGFSLVSVPDLIHPDVVERCGFKTTGERTQVYKLEPHRHGDVALAGTGEMPIAGMLMGKKLPAEDLPQKLMTVSRCYRAETSDTEEERGIYRVHQFTKVEMFGVTVQETGSESEELLKDFTAIQRKLFADLNLHFRILDMASQELGAPAYRKYDMEAWMPAKQFWGEISSASNCTDYQSRRLAIKYEKDGRSQHVHTINGTACAVPRMIMAIVENNQNKDGTVQIPKALRPFMDGMEVLKKNHDFQAAPIKVTKLYKSKTNKTKS